MDERLYVSQGICMSFLMVVIPRKLISKRVKGVVNILMKKIDFFFNLFKPFKAERIGLKVSHFVRNQ